MGTIEDLIKKAEENMTSSGLTTELYIYSILNRRHLVTANEYFFDYDLNRPRSVDLATDAFEATTTDRNATNKNIEIGMVIACKKSLSNLWAFLYADTHT